MVTAGQYAVNHQDLIVRRLLYRAVLSDRGRSSRPRISYVEGGHRHLLQRALRQVRRGRRGGVLPHRVRPAPCALGLQRHHPAPASGAWVSCRGVAACSRRPEPGRGPSSDLDSVGPNPASGPVQMSRSELFTFRDYPHPQVTESTSSQVVFAVGTALAGGPPHRSQRARLTHWAPASGTNVETGVWVWVQHAGRWQPPFREAGDAFPGRARALAAAPQRLVPVPGHLGVESPDRVDVAGHGVVGVVPSHHASQPLPLLRDGQMPPSPEFIFDLMQLGSHPLRGRGAPHHVAPAPGLAADVREAHEVERLRSPESPLCSTLGGEPSELDQARLLGLQLKCEPGKPLAQARQEPFGVAMVLETRNEIISEPHDDHVATCVPPSPLVGPLVEDVVEVDVREQRRYDGSHATANFEFEVVLRRPAGGGQGQRNDLRSS